MSIRIWKMLFEAVMASHPCEGGKIYQNELKQQTPIADNSIKKNERKSRMEKL